jgi:hypothetical protein
MKTLSITACCCVFSFAHSALAANPTWTLHPDDSDQLKAAGIQVSYRLVVNEWENPEYAFTITAKVPEGVDGLDAYFSLSNNKGLIAMHTWSDSEGECVAFFTVGKQALQDAVFMVDHYRGKRTSSDRYVLPLAEFVSDESFQSGRIGIAAPANTTDFRIVAPIQRDGSLVTIKVTPKDALSNHHYDFHVTVESLSDQHIQVRNGQAITRSDVRLADLNGDGLLDIMIVGGPDHRGRDWYKTLLYDRDKGGYDWITDEPDSPDK